jgi:sensor c-di-GMP phosphodiesterase-like protein
LARSRHALWRTVGLILVSAGLGGLLAFVTAHSLILAAAQGRLANYATALLQQDEHLSVEINTVLEGANNSTAPFCSDDDLTQLRRLLFRSHFLKDVGRERGQLFFCSAIVGRLGVPVQTGKPDIVTGGGRLVYEDVPLSAADGFRGKIVAFQNADVVLSPDVFSSLYRPEMFFNGAIVNRKLGTALTTYTDSPQPIPPAVMLRPGQSRWNGDLYDVQCSTIRPDCVLTGISMQNLWAPNRNLILISVTAGVAIGAAFSGLALFMSRRRRSLANQLRRAIKNRRLSVLYQPIVDLRTKRTVGAEALVRWTDEDGNHIRPDLFISIAEEHRFIGEITTFVLDRVTQDFADLFRAHPAFRVSVNMSAMDLLDPTFPTRLDHLLAARQVPAASIGLELTERSTADRNHVVKVIHQLRARGHVIYIDDFGTGYSSLAYLSELSVDVLKVDRAFTSTIGTNSVTASIVPQILAMAQALELKIVVEGVETEEQSNYLNSVDSAIQAQGWLFGRPISPQEMRNRL